MAQCTFSGPLRVGDTGEGSTANVGTPNLVQSTTLTQNGADANVSGTLYLPASSKIIDIIVDNLTVFDSATSATVSVGTAAAGTQYASGVNAKTAGRIRPTFTSAQLTTMNGIGANTTLVATVTVVGATTAGITKVTVVYNMV
jgi:hypothetical protein